MDNGAVPPYFEKAENTETHSDGSRNDKNQAQNFAYHHRTRSRPRCWFWGEFSNGIRCFWLGNQIVAHSIALYKQECASVDRNRQRLVENTTMINRMAIPSRKPRLYSRPLLCTSYIWTFLLKNDI